MRRAVEDIGGGRQDILDFRVWCCGWGRVVEFQQGLQMRRVNGHLGGNKSPLNMVGRSCMLPRVSQARGSFLVIAACVLIRMSEVYWTYM